VPRHAAWLGADWAQDAEQTKLGLHGIAPDWLIVDHYGIDARWERALRPYVGKIMVIDDLADREHDCDLLLDQNLQSRPNRYQGLVPETCRLLLGPRYALLRPQFSEARKRLRARDGRVRRILVAFGGVDAQGATLLSLEAIARLNRPDIAVDAVITSAYPKRQAIESRCQQLPNVRIHCDVEDMAGLMANADLAIGAGGAMTWERCCVGLPSLVIAIADNQRSIAEACAAQGSLVYLGAYGELKSEYLASELYALLHQPAKLISISMAARKLVDEHGCQRVVSGLIEGVVLV
jgi:UDP-2,4-diacetamido-2,4,6-trideoxy-beta-L-altropyranose hydrolase